MNTKLLSDVKWTLLPTIDRWSDGARAKAAMKQYKSRVGRDFDLNDPKLFTEKIIWYKLNYKHPDLGRIVDKVDFKDYVREKLGDGWTIPMYGVYDTIDQLKQSWDALPGSFVLKSTVMSDGKGIKIVKDKSKADAESIFREFAHYLKPHSTLINSYCRSYYGLRPRLLTEAFESEVDGQLYDYKIFCFNGSPCYVYVATDHFPGQLSHISFYDLDWNRLDVTYGPHPNCEVERPKHYPQMLEVARKLSQGFPFIRVDFFDTPDRLYAAELTLYPGGGLTPIHPESFDRILGDLFVLPERA